MSRLAFSCRRRNVCPSCQAKRPALFAEHVVTELLDPVPHRRVLERLHCAERFSVHGEQTVPTEDACGMRTPPDPLDLIHALTTQIHPRAGGIA